MMSPFLGSEVLIRRTGLIYSMWCVLRFHQQTWTI